MPTLYASGHRTTMRIQRSFRGKKAQQEALLKLMNKSAKYGKSAARSTATGTVLKKSAAKLMKGAFRPISILAVFNVSDFSDGTMDAKYKAMAKLYVLSELEIYCERNNNYQAIINQQYLDNADKY